VDWISNVHSARQRFRQAQIQAKRNVANERAIQRRQLFAHEASSEEGSLPPTARRKFDGNKPKSHDETVAASGDVTTALQRTLRLLQTEVQRSHFAQEILEQSTESLKQLGAQYSDLDSLLASSKGLLSTLVTSTKSDTWYLETTFYLLIGTIAWLVFRRFLYGPLWWLVWLPLKLTFRWLLFPLLGLATTSRSVTGSGGIPSVVSGSTIASISMSGNPSTATGTDAADRKDDKLSESLEKVAQSIETDAQAVESKEEKFRGDGTKLVDSDAPRNPKKRVMEVPKVESENKDEL
jgi:protein transport protein SEC20